MGTWLMRESRVRNGSLLALVALVVACTDGGPAETKPAIEAPGIVEPPPGQPNTSAQPKEVAPEAVAPEAVTPEAVAPEVTPVEVAPIVTPPHDGPPRLEVVVREVAPEDKDELCPYLVEARGLPAISEDGTTLLAAYANFDGRSEFKDNLELTWLDVANSRIEQAYVHERPRDDRETELSEDCKKSEALTRERVEQLNAELHTRKWRGLETLDALYSKPGSAQALEQFAAYDGSMYVDEVLEKLAAADRPLEVYYHVGHLIGRVRGMKVLQDTVLPDYRQHENEFCDTAPNIAAIHFDRATKLAVMKYNHHEEGCLCDEYSYFARIELSPELIAEADQRKSTKFRSAYATYLVVVENEGL
jgi:hypothetical protein